VSDETELVARLRSGDEAAFVALVERFHAPMLRLARSYVPSDAVAEEVVQDAWLGVVRGIDRFEGRSSLKTWLFHIVANRARSTGVRERRTVPVAIEDDAALPGEAFTAGGAWASPPTPWTTEVENRLVAAQAVERIAACLGQLPESQRRVVTLRDVEGLSAEEVCSALGITAANQRVLLHRGRARIRSMLADLAEEVSS
jgi:RNA polymerase sigma-70 factor, ECF subfamily